jgi:putative acetyltransferase
MTITLVTEADRSRLMEVWESSVRATHGFLSEQDLEVIIPLARAELAHLTPVHCLRDAGESVCAFMAVIDRKIETLFIAPTHRGMGAGRRLVEYAISELAADKVDVNEQNHQAVGFYERMGFRTIARTPSDAQGLPYPILEMKLIRSTRPEPPTDPLTASSR